MRLPARWHTTATVMIGLTMLTTTTTMLAAAPAAADDDGAPAVVVAVDAPSYAPGDAISVTVTNGGNLAVSPNGGLVCQGSVWPLRLQTLDASGAWQDVPVARRPPCVAIAAALLPPGESLSKTLAAGLDPGQYRLVYPYSATDGSRGSATSDPFTVG